MTDPVIRQLEVWLAQLRLELWPLVWLLESRPYVAALVVTGLILAILIIIVERKISFDRRYFYREAVWVNANTRGRRRWVGESLGWGLRRIIAVVSALSLSMTWLAVQFLVLYDLALYSVEFRGREGWVLAVLGVEIVLLAVLVQLHTLFVSRKRAEKEMDDRVSNAYDLPVPVTVPPTPAVKVLGVRDPDKAFIGWGTGLMIIIANLAYLVSMLGIYFWLAKIAF